MMEFLAMAAVLVTIIGVPVAVVVLLLGLRNRVTNLERRTTGLTDSDTARRKELRLLRERVEKMEDRFRRGEIEAVPLEMAVTESEPVTVPVMEAETPALPLDLPPEPEAPVEIFEAPALETHQTAPVPAESRKGWSPSHLLAKLPVWVGSVALALAGAFMVKYSMEHGLIGETARVVIAMVFGLAMIGTGEWIKRRAEGVAQGLVAAGVAVLYAGSLAGVQLYEIIPPGVGIVLMIVITTGAVLLSLRHGMLVALLGLVGGFLTPYWIGAEEPRPGLMFTYLLLLQAGLMAIIRRRQWWPLAALTMAGGFCWAGIWTFGSISSVGSMTPRPAGIFVILSVALFVMSTVRFGRTDEKPAGIFPIGIVYTGAGIGTALLAAMVGVARFDPVEWAMMMILSAGCLVLGRLDETYRGLPWLASAVGALLLLTWAGALESEESVRFGIVASVLGVMFCAGAYVSLWGSRRPGNWATLSAASAIAYTLILYAGENTHMPGFNWGVICLPVASVLALFAYPVLKRREILEDGETVLAALAVGTVAMVSIAVPIELKRALIPVAWSLEVPALAWIIGRLRIRYLDRIAWALGVIAAAWLLFNPMVFDYPIAESLLANWLLYGYGIPIAAFVVAAYLFRRNGETPLARALEIGALALGFAMLTLEVRHAFHRTDLAESGVPLSEWSAYVITWLLYALALVALNMVTGRKLFRKAGVIAGFASLGLAVVMLCLVSNPLWSDHGVGETIVFNWLLVFYALPALLAAVFARTIASQGGKTLSRLAGAVSLVLLFLTVSLEVRQAFQGNILSGGDTPNSELYTYSAAWILLAVALLAAAYLTRGVILRYGSATIMGIAVIKVFLVDTAHLTGLYRVFSLFGLGVTLLVLAYIYQRLVFSRDGEGSLDHEGA